MKRLTLFILIVLSAVEILAQNKDTATISITNFKLYPGTFSWRVPGNVGSFFDMTSWDSSPYTQGHLKQGSSFRMNYRLLYPLAHNPNYQPGYPLIVMLHGAGERANCWNGQCYFGTTSYSPNTSPAGATQDQLNSLLNNDHNLVHGGSPHLDARNLAAGKLPNDPTLDPRAFPGFILFPQMLNGWDGQYEHAIRIIRLLVKQLNIDPNRIYIHGLSNGGHGVLNTVRTADWLFAAAAPMSAIPSHSDFRGEILADSLTHIPFWMFQGGQDGNPLPSYTEETIRRMRASGLSVRYTLYPSLGHGVWNTAYAEPDFFSWLLSHNKSDIHVYYGNPTICGTTGEGAKLGLAQGFPGYQWELDGEIIPGATNYQYIATLPGIYRARFSRVPNPSESQWNIWSKPVTVTEVLPGKASIEAIGTTHLRGPDNINDSTHNSVTIRSAQPDDNYYWYRNGVLVDIPYNLQDDSVRNFTLMRTASGFNGAYTLKTAGFDNCPTLESEPIYLFFNNSALNVSGMSTPADFFGTALSGSSILLRWRDRTTLERGYEIWRRKAGAVPPPFVFVKRTAEDAIQFVDTNLVPNTTYEYKIRAINNQGKSNYTPSNDLAINLSVTTLSDNVAPVPPQNVTAVASGNRKITLTWTPPSDSDVEQYYIYFGSDSVAVPAPASGYTFSGLALNSTFIFTVKAVDVGGLFSQASSQVTANTFVTGLFYKHSTGAWATLDDPTLQATFVNPEFTGVVPNFTLAPRTQQDFFNFHFEGYLSITTGGTYRFRLASDDGARLYIDNVLRINNDGLHGMTPTVQSNNLNLTAGPHEIRVEFFENGGGEGLTVEWRGPDAGGSYVLIPDVKLRSGTAPPPPTPPVAPTNLSATAVSMTGIDLDWDYSGQNPEGLKIVVLGSSTAAGIVGVTAPSKAWVPRLTAWLSQNTTNLNITNLGTGGFDTYKVMPTGSTPAPDVTKNITFALSLNPRIILVNLPTNDVANAIPLATTMANFRAIKSLADARGVAMFITTSQPRNFSTQADRDLLDVTADSIRAAFGSYVIDIYDELTDFSNGKNTKTIYKYTGDNIHLNDSGHYYIYEQTRNKLMAYLNNFEVQRSLAEAGPFTTIARTETTQLQDRQLLAGTQYFYRVRTVNVNGTSPFTTVVNATTGTDNVAPSQPLALNSPTRNMTSISLLWTASTDNIAVTGYQIWLNGIMVGTSPNAAYMPANLNPGTLYSIYVRAYDAAGNLSVPSASINVTTNASIRFYSKNTGLLTDPNNWGPNTDGSGTPVPNFGSNGNIFVVSNRVATDLGGSLTVEGTISKMIVPNGVTLNVDNALDARVDVEGTGTLNLNYAGETPQLLTLSSTSTVNYNYVDDVVFIQQKPYGNLGLAGAGPKSFAQGNTNVSGILSIGTGVGVRGAFGNLTTVSLGGDLIGTGTPGSVPPENTITLNMTKSGVQALLTSGKLDLFQLTTNNNTTVNIQNSGSPNTIQLGSINGGGIQLPTGSTLNIGGNNLRLIGSAVINGANETGRLRVNDGEISVTSTSTISSNLYFDPVDKMLARLDADLTGVGDINIQSPLNINEGLKISHGIVNAGGNITLLSSLTQTANLEEIENNGEVTGDVTVQRYIHAKGRIYRYISSSVADVTVADWQNYIPITGTFSGASTGPGLGTTPSMFSYDNNAYVAYPVASNTEPIERGRGYSVFVRNTTSATVLQTAGVPYQGEIAFDIADPIPGDPNSGWNLLGNPYASTIAWSLDNTQWPRSGGLSSVISVRQNNADTLGINQYRYFDALTGTGNLSGGRIAPGQAFWIQTTTAASNLSIRESAKRVAQQFYFREGETPVSKLTLNLSQGTKTDAAFIVLTSVGTNFFDPDYDGIKRINDGIFNFSTLPQNSNTALAINNISNSFCGQSIRLNLQNTPAGNYTISAPDVDLFRGSGTVTLVDNLTNTTTNLRTSSYTFNITSDAMTLGSNRFVLNFDRPELNLAIESSVADACHQSGKVSLHNTQHDVQYVVVDNNGKSVTAEVIGNGEDINLEINREFLINGENHFRVKAEFLGCSSGYLDKEIVFVYSSPSMPLVLSARTCPASTAVIEAKPGDAGATYAWYAPGGERIKGEDGPVLHTGPIYHYTEYFVAEVRNGCEGIAQIAPIYVPDLSVPEIYSSRDQMFVKTTGGIQWFKDGVPLFNEVGASLTPRSSGNYAVSVTLDGCSIMSEPKHWNFELEASVYPNPGSSDDLRVLYRSSGEDVVRIIISDVMGKVHVDETFEANMLVNGMGLKPKNRFNPGVYFAQIIQNGTIHKVRFVVE